MQRHMLERDRLVASLEAARPRLDVEEQRVAVMLYRLLAQGRPVSPERLAERARVEPEAARRLVEDQPGVFRDDAGRVIGFWGLALDHMPHRLHVSGRDLRAWCAWDTLFLPELLGQAARVESPCPVTGGIVELTVDASGVREVSPAGAVLSFLRRDRPFDAETINTFCHYVHFFASKEAGEDWTARHEGTFLLSIEDGFEIGRRLNRSVFGRALQGDLET